MTPPNCAPPGVPSKRVTLVEEELMPEGDAALAEVIPGYDDEARNLFAGGLGDEPGEEVPLAEVE